MKLARILTLMPAVLASLFLMSCSAVKKEKDSQSSLLSDLPAGESEEATVERLKELANLPNATLPPSQSSDNSEPEFTTATPPPSSWADSESISRTVYPGDIFSAQSGPVLRKAVSIADSLPDDIRENWLSDISKAEQRRIPLTLNASELAKLQEEAGEDVALPTRSVALDFKTVHRSPAPSILERQFAAIALGTPPASLSEGANINQIANSLSDVKQRLEKGEKLFIITSVTESDVVAASYPGAPLGRRDADLILNAFSTLYPHLDRLSAEKDGDYVAVTRPPSIYWEFEVRELKVENDRLVIDRQPLAQN